MSLSTVLERLRVCAESDTAMLETLRHLADADRVEAPFAPPPDDLRRLATEVNRRRQDDRLAELRARSLTTRDVVSILASVSDRKGVDRRRHRGRLLGIRDGNRMLHPEWQFDRRRGETWPGLALVLDVVLEVAGDELDADAIAVAPRPEAGGASVADLLGDGDVTGALALAHLAGDQS